MDIPNLPEQFQGLAAFSMEKIPPDVHPDPPPAAIPRSFSLLPLFPTFFQGILERKSSPPRPGEPPFLQDEQILMGIPEFPGKAGIPAFIHGYPTDIPRNGAPAALRDGATAQGNGKTHGWSIPKIHGIPAGNLPRRSSDPSQEIPSPVPFSREFPARLHWE